MNSIVHNNKRNVNIEEDDLVIFRQNGYLFFLLSFLTFNLDNDFGIYKVIDNEEYILKYLLYWNGYIPSFKLSLEPWKYYKNKVEFYNYTCKESLLNNENVANDIFYEKYDIQIYHLIPIWINLLTSTIIKRSFLNEPLKKFISNYYRNNINYYNLQKNFHIKSQNNFHKKHNYLYAIATCSMFLFDIQNFIHYIFYSILNHVCVITSCSFFNKLTLNQGGKRFIGFLYGVAFQTLFFDHNLAEQYKYVEDLVRGLKFSISFPLIIFGMRIASWFNNDIYGKTNPNTLRPYDTSLYEAYFTGLLPYLLHLCLFDIYIKNNINPHELFFYIYSITRFIIEFWKQPYHNQKFTFTLGQFDCIYTFVFTYLHFNHYKTLTVVWSFLYLDFNYRYFLNKTINLYKNNWIEITYIPKQNWGFSFGTGNFFSKYIKIIINILSISLTYYLSNNLILLLCCLPNFFERIYYGYVNDYLKIQIFNKGFICNISDILMFIIILFNIKY